MGQGDQAPAQPHIEGQDGQVPPPELHGGGVLRVPRRDFAPNLLRGYWQRLPDQRRLMPRLRCGMLV